MKISVFGLGYVGTVSGACLAKIGHRVTGVDINEQKVTMINNGKSTIVEKDIDQIVKAVVEQKKFSATLNSLEAVLNSDVALICVGTPSLPNGSLDPKYIINAAKQIGESLKNLKKYFVVVIRSTVFPGTIDSIVIPILEEFSGKKAGVDFGICMNPEFLREGSSVYDFFKPPKHDIGGFDKKVNISPTYLKPGVAFGGSCLPKDLRVLTYKAKESDIEIPLIKSILVSNKMQIGKVVDKLLEYKGKRVGFLGLSFKYGTDDLRESPIVEVIETIIGKGFSVRIYDPFVSLSRLIGGNRQYIEREIPHIMSLLVTDPDDLLNHSDIVVVGNKCDEYRNMLVDLAKEKTILDLVRIVDDWSTLKAGYYGICW